MTGPHELRIGDAEREAAVTALGEHYAAGRLTKEEYDERADRAMAARTSAQLFPLFTDLPRLQGAARPAPGAVPQVTVHPRRSHPGRLPVLLIVLGVLLLAHHPAVILIVLGVWLLVTRLTGHFGGHGHSESRDRQRRR